MWKLFILGGLVGSLIFQVLPSSAEQGEPLAVPFLTQFDGSAYAATDCGPASAAMAIRYASGEKITPLQVRQAIMKLPGGGYAASTASGTAIGDLGRVARAHDVATFMGDGAASTGWGAERIRKHLSQGHPVIVLTRLGYLPGYSQGAEVDHYILLTGATPGGYVYNDPALSNGARRTITEKQLQLAQRMSSVPGQGAAFEGPAMSAAAIGEAKSLDAGGEPKVLDPARPTVTIARGDTLSALALRLGVRLEELVAINRDQVRNADHIEVGQVLKVPVPEPPQERSPEAENQRTEVKVR